jgi:hypothetical protein
VNALVLHYDEIVDIVGRGGSEGFVSKLRSEDLRPKTKWKK